MHFDVCVAHVNKKKHDYNDNDDVYKNKLTGHFVGDKNIYFKGLEPKELR